MPTSIRDKISAVLDLVAQTSEADENEMGVGGFPISRRLVFNTGVSLRHHVQYHGSSRLLRTAKRQLQDWLQDIPRM
jgi:hypothetical protein